MRKRFDIYMPKITILNGLVGGKKEITEKELERYYVIGQPIQYIEKKWPEPRIINLKDSKLC